MTEPHRSGSPDDPSPRTSRVTPGSRRGFGVTILLAGLAGVLAAVGGSHAWATVDADPSFAGTSAGILTSIERAKAPVVTAVALVVLAAYGVMLVTRGWVRRALAVLAALVAVALVVAAAAAWVQAPRAVVGLVGSDAGPVHRTGWAVVSLVSTVVLLATSVVAVLRVGTWPEMGRRYDAPVTSALPEPELPPEEQTSLDLWRTIDEGHDPTRGPDH